MPFTGAHPLAIAPLLRLKWLDPTSLVIGSMAPDFQYFVYGHEKGLIGHSMLGLVVWCIPVVVIVGLLFHHVVKWPLLVAAPQAWARRLAPSAAAGWPLRPVAIAVSAVLGGASHDVWDSCTHSPGFVVSHFPNVLRVWVDIPGIDHPVLTCRLLQYVCSSVGFVAVGWLVARAVRRMRPVEWPGDLPRVRARLVFAACSAGGCAAVFWRVQRYLDGPSAVVVAAISGILFGMVLAGLLLRNAGLRARSVSAGRDTTSAWHG
jgi:hypothetical protein